MRQLMLRVFGVYHYPATGFDFTTNCVTVDEYHMQKILPGFGLGASYGSYPLSKVLELAHANFKIRTIVKQDNAWTYTFEHTETGITFSFVASRHAADVETKRQRPPVQTERASMQKRIIAVLVALAFERGSYDPAYATMQSS